jgi:hypothetical protein
VLITPPPGCFFLLGGALTPHDVAEKKPSPVAVWAHPVRKLSTTFGLSPPPLLAQNELDAETRGAYPSAVIALELPHKRASGSAARPPRRREGGGDISEGLVAAPRPEGEP